MILSHVQYVDALVYCEDLLFCRVRIHDNTSFVINVPVCTCWLVHAHTSQIIITSSLSVNNIRY